MISDRTKQLVDKFIQEGVNSPVRGWSMSEVLEKVRKVKGSVPQAREYILDSYDRNHHNMLNEWEEMR